MNHISTEIHIIVIQERYAKLTNKLNQKNNRLNEKSKYNYIIATSLSIVYQYI